MLRFLLLFVCLFSLYLILVAFFGFVGGGRLRFQGLEFTAYKLVRVWRFWDWSQQSFVSNATL